MSFLKTVPRIWLRNHECKSECPDSARFEPAHSLEASRSFPASTWTLLLRVAAAAVDGSSLDHRAIPFDAIGWATLAADAEGHGLAPLAHFCLGPHRDALPEATMQQLDALVLRHRAMAQRTDHRPGGSPSGLRTGFHRHARSEGCRAGLDDLSIARPAADG